MAVKSYVSIRPQLSPQPVIKPIQAVALMRSSQPTSKGVLIPTPTIWSDAAARAAGPSPFKPVLPTATRATNSEDPFVNVTSPPPLVQEPLPSKLITSSPASGAVPCAWPDPCAAEPSEGPVRAAPVTRRPSAMGPSEDPSAASAAMPYIDSIKATRKIPWLWIALGALGLVAISR